MIDFIHEDNEIERAKRSKAGSFSYGSIYHYSMKIISRGKGQNAVAAAAYRAGVELIDERTGEVKDFTRKEHVDFSEIAAPENAPAWVKDRQRLWNEVEAVEVRKNSRLCREVNAALPKALTLEEQKVIVRQFVVENFTKRGMVTDWNIHDSQGNNPHVHMMTTTREIGPEGFDNKNRDWNKKEFLLEQRESWAKVTNKELERLGYGYRIDHRSLEAQGIDRIPTKHLGPRPSLSRRAEHDQILQANVELAQLTKELKQITTRQEAIHTKAEKTQAKQQTIEPQPEPQKVQELTPERTPEPQQQNTPKVEEKAQDKPQPKQREREAWPEDSRELWRMEERPKVRAGEIAKMVNDEKDRSQHNLPIREAEARAEQYERIAKQERIEAMNAKGKLLGRPKKHEKAANEALDKAKLERDDAKRLTTQRDKLAVDAVKTKLATDLNVKAELNKAVEKGVQERETAHEPKAIREIKKAVKMEQKREALKQKQQDKQQEAEAIKAMTPEQRKAHLKEKRIEKKQKKRGRGR